MSNDTFTEKISLWLDDQLSPAEVTELKNHLAHCQHCRQVYQSIQQVHRLFHSAGRQMAAPAPRFSQRFEARLARHRARKPWQLWLAMAALLLGALFVGAWALVSSLTVVSLGFYLLDADLLYRWLITFIESVAGLRLFLRLSAIFLRASYATMGQPIFWGYVVIALGLVWLWVRSIQKLARRAFVQVDLLV